VSSVTLCYTVW